MSKISIDVDYSNICKDYNTSYLDRDNTDPETKKCMKQILSWTNEFIAEFLKFSGYKIYKLQSSDSVEINEVASKRFLFYSLEKEITLQSFAIQKEYMQYASLEDWKIKNNEGILLQNDEDGEGIYIYLNEGSEEHEWIAHKLKDFS